MEISQKVRARGSWTRNRNRIRINFTKETQKRQFKTDRREVK
jgi:hypothetical protein